MKRIHVHYGGVRYTVANREVSDLKAEIAEGLASESPSWLMVNHGEGTLRETDLLIAHGIDIAITPIDAESEDPLPPQGATLPAEGT